MQTKLHRAFISSALAAILLASTHAQAQAADIPSAASEPTQQDAAQHGRAQTPQGTIATATGALPHFEAATIKPPDPKGGGMVGFVGSAGGRIFFGGNLNMLVQFAFRLQPYQVTGGPDWTRSQRFEIDAVPPDNSPSRTISVRNAEPTPEQRQMLQSLLRDRFGLNSHMESKDGEVYVLSRGSKTLQFHAPKNTEADPRAIVVIRSDGIHGEAIGTNTTTDYLAVRLSSYLRIPVLNQTGIQGSYDFNLPPDDTEGNDLPSAVFRVVDRLGLKITRGRGPIQTLVIDHVEHPDAN